MKEILPGINDRIDKDPDSIKRVLDLECAQTRKLRIGQKCVTANNLDAETRLKTPGPGNNTGGQYARP